jgi:hypothetical protein
MKTTTLVLLSALTLAGCTYAPEKARAIIAVQNPTFTQIETGGYQWIGGCDANDDKKTKFTATGAHGEHVKGVICGHIEPWGKAATVRIIDVKAAK